MSGFNPETDKPRNEFYPTNMALIEEFCDRMNCSGEQPTESDNSACSGCSLEEEWCNTYHYMIMGENGFEEYLTDLLATKNARINDLLAPLPCECPAPEQGHGTTGWSGECVKCSREIPSEDLTYNIANIVRARVEARESVEKRS